VAAATSGGPRQCRLERGSMMPKNIIKIKKK
jgi:hypothetical protein